MKTILVLGKTDSESEEQDFKTEGKYIYQNISCKENKNYETSSVC